MDSSREVLAALAIRIRDGEVCEMVADAVPYAPLTPDQLAAAERALQLELPDFVRCLYLEIGNGGYGPGYGLLGLNGGAIDDLVRNAVDVYVGNCDDDPDDPQWYWPRSLVPLIHLGCAMYLCVDVETGAAVCFDPNTRSDDGDWSVCFHQIADSFADVLARWLVDEDYLTEGKPYRDSTTSAAVQAALRQREKALMPPATPSPPPAAPRTATTHRRIALFGGGVLASVIAVGAAIGNRWELTIVAGSTALLCILISLLR